MVDVATPAEPLTRTIAWRVPTSEYVGFIPLLETFPERSWAKAFRWLFDDPRVKAVIDERIAGSMTSAR